jgi:hypothetical protein
VLYRTDMNGSLTFSCPLNLSREFVVFYSVVMNGPDIFMSSQSFQEVSSPLFDICEQFSHFCILLIFQLVCSVLLESYGWF